MATIADILAGQFAQTQGFLQQGQLGQQSAALNQLAQQQQIGRRQQDVQALRNFGAGVLPAGVQGPQPQFPNLTSQAGVGGQLAGLLEQRFGDPFGERRALTTQRLRPSATSTRQGSFQQITDPVTGQQVNALIDPVTGNIIRNFGTVEEGLSAKDKITVAVTQAKEFRADPRIKNLNIIERSERGMQAALKMATSPNVKSRIASDQTLGVLFQKMLDPESVVRESEFARTPEGAAAVNRLLAIAPQLQLGGLRLLDEDRQALVTMAQKLLQEAKITANRAFDEFEIRADTIGLNKQIVFGGAKRFNIQEPEKEGKILLDQVTPDQLDNMTPAQLDELERQAIERQKITPQLTPGQRKRRGLP